MDGNGYSRGSTVFSGGSRSGEDEGREAQSWCVDDSLPNDEQALCEWVDSKMLELRDATDVGDLESVITLTKLIGQGASKMRSATRQPSILSNMVVS